MRWGLNNYLDVVDDHVLGKYLLSTPSLHSTVNKPIQNPAICDQLTPSQNFKGVLNHSNKYGLLFLFPSTWLWFRNITSTIGHISLYLKTYILTLLCKGSRKGRWLRGYGIQSTPKVVHTRISRCCYKERCLENYRVLEEHCENELAKTLKKPSWHIIKKMLWC